MSFGAMAAWQGWLLLAGAGALAAWLFLLKLRPPRILVPSLLLWRRVLDESRELTLWERIRRTVSLVVTVLVALTLALAASRPAPVGGAAAASHGRLLIVMDSSWSMMARTQGGGTRRQRAIAEARRLAASGDEIALATTADGLVEGPTTDLALIETTLDRIAPGGGDTTSWPRVPGTDAVHFVTDGAIARPLDPGVIVHTVFEAAANVAITAFDVRPALTPDHAGDAYLEIANFAPSAQRVRVTVTRGTTVILDRPLQMAPGEALHQVTALPRGPDAVLRANVTARDNALAIDDEAFAWIDRATPLSVTVVGQRTAWLAALFARDPDVHATFVDPSSYQPGAADVDALIFDRWAPAKPPRRPALYFAPPVDTPWLSGGPEGSRQTASDGQSEEKRPRWEQAGSHPVVRGVDPLTLRIDKARAYRSPALIPVAQSAHGTPLVYVSESADRPPSRSTATASASPADVDDERRRSVVVTFGPGESNLASAPGFPVLVGNALEWLARPSFLSAFRQGPGNSESGPATTSPGQADAGRRPGMMTFDASIARLTDPHGEAVPLARVNGTAVGLLRAPGLYIAEAGGGRGAFAVRVGDPQISNLMKSSLGGGARALPVTTGGSARPWWIYCAAVAFVLVFTEWWTWQRRITV